MSLINNLTRKFQAKRHQAGFTMIEILVVATIIIILSVIALVSYRQAGYSARNGKRHADLESVRQSLVLYRVDNGSYPSGTDFDAMLTTLSDYLVTTDVNDPIDNVTYTYEYSSDGSTFTLTGYEEPDGTSFTVNSP